MNFLSVANLDLSTRNRITWNISCALPRHCENHKQIQPFREDTQKSIHGLHLEFDTFSSSYGTHGVDAEQHRLSDDTRDIESRLSGSTVSYPPKRNKSPKSDNGAGKVLSTVYGPTHPRSPSRASLSPANGVGITRCLSPLRTTIVLSATHDKKANQEVWGKRV